MKSTGMPIDVSYHFEGVKFTSLTQYSELAGKYITKRFQLLHEELLRRGYGQQALRLLKTLECISHPGGRAELSHASRLD